MLGGGRSSLRSAVGWTASRSAIELAAGRVPGFGLEGLVDALDRSVDVLEVGHRSADRHRSMAAAIGWSYDQLGADEQAVLRAGAVFSTPFHLEALVAVIQRPPGSVAAALSRLVDWNLIELRPGVPTQYRILETIRQHADAVSGALEESQQLHRAHLDWCRSTLAALAHRQPHDDDWCGDVDLISAETGGALAWAIDHTGCDASAAALAEVLADVLFDRGRPGETQRRYELAASWTPGPIEQRRLLRLAAGAATARNVGDDAVALFDRSAAVALGDGDHDAAAQDLAQAAGLQYRAVGIMAHPARVATIDGVLDRARATSRGGAIAEAAIALAEGWVSGSTAHSRHHTLRAIDLAKRAQQPLLINEAHDQLTALELDERNLPGALEAIDRRLQLLRDIPVDATSGFEMYDVLHMACHVNLAAGRLRAARRYADDIAALPFFREERHIGLGRRIEVDAIAGNFDAVIERAELFEHDWWRAGRPVAGNLAVGAYAAAMTFGMLADDARRGQWIDITEALLGPTRGLRTTPRTWNAVLDAMLALHKNDPETALSLLTRSPPSRSTTRTTSCGSRGTQRSGPKPASSPNTRPATNASTSQPQPPPATTSPPRSSNAHATPEQQTPKRPAASSPGSTTSTAPTRRNARAASPNPRNDRRPLRPTSTKRFVRPAGTARRRRSGQAESAEPLGEVK